MLRLVILVSVLSVFSAGVFANNKVIKVGILGSFFEKKFKEHIYPDFTKKTGISVKSVKLPSSISAQESFLFKRDKLDVVMMNPMNVRIANHENLLLAFNSDSIPNLKYVIPELVFYQDKEKEKTLSIGFITWYLTLITRVDAYQEAPESWSILWQPNHKVGFRYDLKQSYLLDITAKTFFADETDILKSKEGILRVMKKAVQIQNNVKHWFDHGKDFLSLLSQGSVNIGSNYHDIIIQRIKDDKKAMIRTTFPKEGGVMEYGSFVISAKSDNPVESAEFINYMLSKPVQVKISKILGTAVALNYEHIEDSFSYKEFRERTSIIPPIIPDPNLFSKFGDFIESNWDDMLESNKDN